MKANAESVRETARALPYVAASAVEGPAGAGDD
jgi:hypothetical protein